MKKILLLNLFIYVYGSLFAQLHLDLSPHILLESKPNVDTDYIPSLKEFYDWSDRPAYVNLFFDLNTEILTLYMQIELKSDLLVDLIKDNFKSWTIDPNFPAVGYAQFNYDIFNLSIGRRKLSMGPGYYNLNLSGRAPYFDHVWFNANYPRDENRWSYIFVAATSDNLATKLLVDDDSDDFNGFKTFISHSISYKWPNFIFSAVDTSIIYGRVPDLQELSPLIHYHGLYQRGQNVLLDFNFDWRITPKSRFYGEWIVDDFQITAESTESNPGAMGLLFGAQFQIFDGPGITNVLNKASDHTLSSQNFTFSRGLYIGIESMVTSKYLFNRSEESGKYTNPMLYMWNNDTVAFNTYYGAAYGPDRLINRLSVTYNIEPFKFELVTEHQAIGSFGIGGVYEAPFENWISIVNPLTHEFRISLAGEWVYNKNKIIYTDIKYDFGSYNNLQFMLGWGMNLL